jgi:mannitol 2-dehydrogenase
MPRILHIGVGGFHRAHLALHTHELAEAGGDWAIRGIGLLDADRRMAGVLDSQDHLDTLIERDSNESRARIVGSIVDYTAITCTRTGAVPPTRGGDRTPVAARGARLTLSLTVFPASEVGRSSAGARCLRRPGPPGTGLTT